METSGLVFGGEAGSCRCCDVVFGRVPAACKLVKLDIIESTALGFDRVDNRCCVFCLRRLLQIKERLQCAMLEACQEARNHVPRMEVVAQVRVGKRLFDCEVAFCIQCNNFDFVAHGRHHACLDNFQGFSLFEFGYELRSGKLQKLGFIEEFETSFEGVFKILEEEKVRQLMRHQWQRILMFVCQITYYEV